MKSNLRITNVVCTGKLPFDKKIDFSKVIKKSKFDWRIINEDICPILQVRFLREWNGKTDYTVQKKRKGICVSVWYSGAVNIVGVLSLEEAEKYYKKVSDEMKEILK